MKKTRGLFQKTDMQNKLDKDKSARIRSMKSGNRAVLTPGKSIVYETCQELKDRIDVLIQQYKTEIILDFKGVGFLDSAALELLLETHDELRGQGGTLKIVGLNPICRDILVATRMINVLHVYKDIHEAVTSRS